MNPKTLKDIEQELGQWDTPFSTEMHFLELRLENSDNDIKLYLPSPEGDVTFIARPNGFQLTSNHNNNIRRDFAIEKSQIVSVELLPSFTIDNFSRISLKYLLFSIFAFALIGSFTSGRSENLLLWLFLGLTFGIVLATSFRKTYRQNLLLVIQENSGQKVKFLFSIDRKQIKKSIDFFKSFINDKFTCC